MTETLKPWLQWPVLLMQCMLLGILSGSQAYAAPFASALEAARAQRVTAMPDETPSDRINQLLAARDFNEAELFALAGNHPGIVEHLIPGDLRLATEYLFSLDGAELHRIRNGGTLIRSVRNLSHKEKKSAEILAVHFGVDFDKLRGVKLGPKDGRIYILELTFQIKKKKTATYEMEMVWPTTPAREEQSRGLLTKHFGARPSRVGRGAGSTVPVQDSSFESPYSLADGWRLGQGRVLGAPVPLQEVMLDERTAIDGKRSARFYATERTRVFQNIVQEVPVQPGSKTRLRIQHKTENIRIEYQQRRSDFKVQITYLSNGYPIGSPISTAARQGTHPWELLEIESVVPPSANEARIELICSLSGTAWFDGIVYEIIENTGGW
jgi:hypothetical protein